MKSRKSAHTIEIIILTKILKSWRREMGLAYLKPEIIEILTFKDAIDSQSILIKVNFLIQLINLLACRDFREYNKRLFLQ